LVNMGVNAHLFEDLTWIFLAALVGGVFAWRVGLPVIIGFVVGGIVISPFTPGIRLHDVHTFEELAEVGVVLLMFSIGAEFSLQEMLAVKWVALVGGCIGIAMTVGLAVGIAHLLGWTMLQGVVIGATVSVASTMVLARALADRGAMSTQHGHVMIGITLFEDLAVIFMTVVLPAFGSTDADRYTKAAWTLGKAVILLVPLAILAKTVIPRVLRWARDTKNEEIFLLSAIAICLGTAALSSLAGFSMALGAFLAGFSVSGSEDLHEVHSQLAPLRNAFVALFFVSLGTLLQPKVLASSLVLLGVMLALIVPGKFLVWMLVVKIFGYPGKTAIAVAAGLTQIGELSFVVVKVARDAGMVGDDVFNATLAASLVSIFINVFLARWALGYAGGRTGRGRPGSVASSGAVAD
jgi:monovalent cation:H+ antiporter-2, CPA2 family